jgi:hypothetical protein
MGIFKTKAEKDFERKQKIKQQIRDFERRIIKLEEQIKKHIESAREAVRENLPEQVALTKAALTRTIQERKMTIRMKINFDVFNQLKDQAEANKMFLKSIKLLSEQMEAATSVDAQKVFAKFDMEVEKANDMIEEIQDQLDTQEDKYKKQDLTDIKVTDSEIDNLIFGNASSVSTKVEEKDPLEAKLEELKQKIEKK